MFDTQTAETLRYKQVVIDSPLHSLLVPKPRPSQFSATHCVYWRQKKEEEEENGRWVCCYYERKWRQRKERVGWHRFGSSTESPWKLEKCFQWSKPQGHSSKTSVSTQWCFLFSGFFVFCFCFWNYICLFGF